MFILIALILIVIKILFEKYRGFRKGLIRFFSSEKIHQSFNYLYSPIKALGEEEAFILKRINVIFILLITGCVAAAVLSISQRAIPALIDGYYIERPDYEEAERNLEIIAKAVNEKDQKLKITVSNRKYDDKSISAMSKELMGNLKEIIIGENVSLDNVNKKLNLIKTFKSYPFVITWKSEKPLILGSDGRVNIEALKKRLEETGEESLIVKIIASLSYEDYMEEMEIPVRLTLPEMSDTEEYLLNLKTTIDKKDKESRLEDRLELPKEINAKSIKYEADTGFKAILLFLLSLVAAIMLFVKRDDELSKKINERNEQLESDFPSIVNQYALYYCAGMHPKSIWKEMCNDYRRKLSRGEKRRYVFEEMLTAQALMDDGLGEIAAFSGFAARCRLKQYKNFVNLILQSLTKGKEEMSAVLKIEAEEASNERLIRARKKGEEAGTKLLLPMFMMMSIVLIIVIIPAFINFRV